MSIFINDDFLWCLANLAENREISEFLLLKADIEGKYEFENMTIQNWKKGLPKEYYVIAQYNGNFLCERENSARIFCFSMSLGITNTPYATIYDYLIKRLDERHNQVEGDTYM